MIRFRFYDLFLFPVRHLLEKDDWARNKAIRFIIEKNNIRRKSCRFLPIDTEITYSFCFTWRNHKFIELKVTSKTTTKTLFQEERLNILWRSPAWLVGPGWRGSVWWPTSCPTDQRNQGERLKMREKYNDAFECRRFFSQSGHAEAGQHPRGGDLLGAAQGRLHQIRSVRQSSNIQKLRYSYKTTPLTFFCNIYKAFSL